MGINADDRTLGELYWMVMARRRSNWDQTADLLEMIALAGGVKGVTAEKVHRYPQGGKRKGDWSGVFGAGRQMLAEKRKRQGIKDKMDKGPDQ